MDVALFDFTLPENLIALRPAEPRDAARLLVVGAPGAQPQSAPTLQDRIVGDLPALLRPGDVLVVNNTRVIPSRLMARRIRESTAARVELMLHKRLSADRWLAFARPAKKLSPGDALSVEGGGAALQATVVARGEAGEVEIAFAVSGPLLDAAIARLGQLPLPPYIAGKRPTDARDSTDYQTVYAREEGAVAAPTAGLHFTPELFQALAARGVTVEEVTLHVGAGTFLPVKASDTRDHAMHAEWGVVPEPVAVRLNAARAAGGRIVAVGTTSLRLLESAVDAAGRIQPFSGDTAIFITPGFRFGAVDVLMTNFHLPRSTLFMLVSAFCGLERMKAAYAHAIAESYRFYSYGDSSLLFRQEQPVHHPPEGR
jgi:S-adenosylmethionine:tRNA ribosyltransferase-isomerase